MAALNCPSGTAFKAATALFALSDATSDWLLPTTFDMS